MCGIFGMVGEHAVRQTCRALKYLEYRGYDSAGIAVRNGDGVTVCKTAGRIEALQAQLPPDLDGSAVIGHTRWATHGAVSSENAHPFYSADKRFAIVHNGIIDNYRALKKQFTSHGTVFTSQTDSETVAHLLQRSYDGDVLSAVLKTANCLDGSYAIAIANAYDGKLYAIKNKSPLIVGMSGQGAYFCSDIRCISHWADKVAVTPDKTVVAIGENSAEFYDFDGKPRRVEFFSPEKAELLGAAQGDMMLSEILEIPLRIRDAKEQYLCCGIRLSRKSAKALRRVYLIGCGTAYHSGLQAAAVARSYCEVDLLPVVASEFVCGNYPVDNNTLALLISQSGETADTLRAAEKVLRLGGQVCAVTNTNASSLSLLCPQQLNVRAGGEYAVASTKAYNCQLITLLLALADIARLRGAEADCLPIAAFDELPEAADRILSDSYRIAGLAEQVAGSSAVFYIGRGADYPTAAEGSLKLKEISYIHSEAYPAGELKHGTLALMEQGVTVVAISTDSRLTAKMASSVSEVAARGARVITVSPYGADVGEIFRLPVVNRLLYGVISVVPLQLLAYYTAKRLGRDVDKPRNLAKSVTVE